MDKIKMIKTKNLALYLSDDEFFFGNLVNQGESGFLLIGINEYRFYRPSEEQLNSYMSPNEFDQRVIEIKNFSKDFGNAAIQLMFSGNECLLLQRVYESEELSSDKLDTIARHMHSSFKGRRLAHRGNLLVQRDLYDINNTLYGNSANEDESASE